MKCIIYFIGVVSFCNAFSQSDPEAVYLRKSARLEIAVEGGKLKINEFHNAEINFFRNFDRHTRESVFYSDFDPIISLEAETMVPDKKNWKKIKVPAIETRDIVQPGIFYGGYKRKDFVYPAVAHGTIGRLAYAKEITDPHLLTPFYFNEEVDVRYAEFSVVCPASVNIAYKLFGIGSDKVSFDKRSLSDNSVRYTWTYRDVPAYIGEEDSPGRSYTSPHIVFYVNSYEWRGSTIPVSGSVEDLYSWYHGLVKSIPAHTAEKDVADQVNALTGGLKSDEDKIRAIFQWVQANVKYIAFEDGMAGFIPRSAEDVYRKRYGDCKDMANLLKYMINTAGIEAWHTWIGTRSKPYSYLDVPTTIADNHMICTVKLGDQFVFLDATSPFVPFGLPTSMIQGKEALVGLGDSKFELVTVPVVGPSVSQRTDSISVALSEEGVRGRVLSVLRGYRKTDLEYRQLKAEIDNDRQYIRDYFRIGGNNVEITDLQLDGLTKRSHEGIVRFSFFQPGYVKSAGNRTYVNLNLHKPLAGPRLDLEKRLQPVEQDYCFEDKSVVTLELPPGYSVTYLPEKSEMKWPEFGVTASYAVVGNVVVYERVVYSNHLYLGKDAFSLWNEFIEGITSVGNQTVVLTRNP